MTSVYGLSGDGLTSVGSAWPVGGQHQRAFRYRGGVYQNIGSAGFQASEAVDASYDGSVIVGRLQNDNGLFAHAARWTEATGWQILSYRPQDFAHQARAVNRDGSVVVGLGTTDSYDYAFAWTQSAGMVELPRLTHEAIDASALGVNSIGDIVVGTSAGHAVAWVEGEIRDLGILGNRQASALGVSDDGSVIVGESSYSRPGMRFGSAFVWTDAGGLEYMDLYLARFGVTVPEGWLLISGKAVSADGLTFAGQIVRADGSEYQGFVATVPTPCTALLVTLGLSSLRRRS